MFKFKLFGIDATFHEEDFSLIYEGEKYFYSTEVIDNEDKAVYFKLNNKCNLKCVYCFQKEEVDNKISLNLMHYKNLIEHLFLEYNSFKFFGGEPFISTNYTNIKYLFENCKNKKISAFTNGTFNSAYYDLLADNKDKIESITITLDGCAEVHDKRRVNSNGKGTFESIISNIKMLSVQNIQTVIQINIDCLNYSSIKDLLMYINGDSILQHCMIVLNRVLHDNDSITNLQLLQLYVNLVHEFHELHIEVNSPTIRQLTSIFTDSGLTTNRCSAGKTIVIDFQENKIYGCPEESKTVCGNITNNDMVLNYSEIDKLISYSKKEVTTCNSCKYIYFCHLGCSIDRDLKMDNCKETVNETVQYVLDHFTDFFNIESDE